MTVLPAARADGRCTSSPVAALRPDLEGSGVLLRVLAVPYRAINQPGGAHHILGYGYLHLGGGLLVQRDLVDLLRHAEVVRVFLEQAPALVLGEEPHAVGQVGEVDRAVVMELHVVGVVPFPAEAVFIFAFHALVDDVHRAVHIGFVGNDVGHAAAVGHHVDVARGFQQGHDHGACGVGVLVHELRRAAQHLFRVVLPDVLCGGRGEADLVGDGAIAPGFAHAEAVHVTDAHVGHHLRRRHGDVLDVLERVNAVTGQPVIQPHGMGASGEGLGKGVVALAAVHHLLQGFTGGGALVLDLVGQGDGLAVVVQRHQYGHVFLRTADAEMYAIDQAVQN